MAAKAEEQRVVVAMVPAEQAKVAAAPWAAAVLVMETRAVAQEGTLAVMAGVAMAMAGVEATAQVRAAAAMRAGRTVPVRECDSRWPG